ncbi:MAG TPA: hypothetical protein VIK32_05820, partial [Candidatus Limnocylindrales bacterium]
HRATGWWILRDVLDPLFSGTPIGKAIADQRRKALEDIAAQPPGVLLERPLDELVAERVERWRFDPLVLNWSDKKIAPSSEFDRVISGRSQSGKIAGTALTLVVPFTGMPGLLRMRPSTHARNPPGGFIWGKILLLSYVGVSPDDATVQRDLNRQEAVVKERVSSINRDVGVFNAELPGLLRNALQARLDKIRADENLVAALKIPRAALQVPRAALEVPRRQRRTSRPGHTKANPAELGHAEAQPTPRPDGQASGRLTRPSPRPRTTRLLTRAMVFQALRDLEVDAAAGRLRTSDGRIRPYVTMQDLADKREVSLSTVKDFLRDEPLSWRDRGSWPPE